MKLAPWSRRTSTGAISKNGEFSFCPENAAAAINGACPHNTVPGEVALCIDRACRIRSRKRPVLERESKVQKKE
jgi:hypothetical protein